MIVGVCVCEFRFYWSFGFQRHDPGAVRVSRPGESGFGTGTASTCQNRSAIDLIQPE